MFSTSRLELSVISIKSMIVSGTEKSKIESNDESGTEKPRIKPSNESELETEKKKSLPKHPVEIIKMKKSGGITIPKKIRESLRENDEEVVLFAFWQDDNKLIFQQVKEYEVPDLTLVQSEKKKADPSKPRKKRSSKKKSKTSGPEPELAKYFPFQIENQDKIANALESTFYKLIEIPPKIEEAIERIKYVVLNYSTGSNTNDARLKNTIIFFIADVIEKNKDPSLKDVLVYAKENLISNIRSKYLKEQSLIILSVAAIGLEANEIAFELISNILRGIQLYTEPYAIMQGFKGTVKALTRSQLAINERIVEALQIAIINFIKGFNCPGKLEDDPPITHSKASTDNALQLIELLQDLHLIEEAFVLAKELLAELPQEDIYIEQVRQKIADLKKVNI